MRQRDHQTRKEVKQARDKTTVSRYSEAWTEANTRETELGIEGHECDNNKETEKQMDRRSLGQICRQNKQRAKTDWQIS